MVAPAVAVALAACLLRVVAPLRTPGGATGAAPPEARAALEAAAELVRDHGIWVSDRVRMAWLGPERGCGIVAVAPIANGEVLLRATISAHNAVAADGRHPWESEAFHRLLEEVQQEPNSGAVGSAHLGVKLTNLLLHLGRRSASGPLERYVEASAASPGPFVRWPAAARELLRGSAILAQAEAEDAAMRRAAPAYAAAWPLDAAAPRPSLEEFCDAWRRADALVGTRAFSTARFGTVFVPVLDFVNHAGPAGSNTQYSFEGDGWELRAVGDIAAGQELFACYDDAADYLEMWARYGFFDDTAEVHTVDVVVRPGAISPGHPGGIYWIPCGTSPMGSPLFGEVAAAARSAMGAGNASGAAVRRQAVLRMRELIRAHLAGYASDAEAVLAPSGDDDPLRAYRRSAGVVVRYEQSLLSAVLAKLEKDVVPRRTPDPPQSR